MVKRKVLFRNCILLMTIIVHTMLILFSSTNSYAYTNWWNESFDYRLEINITNNGSTNLSDFPIYLNITKETGMQIDYDDIRFIEGGCLDINLSNATILDYEREYNDSSKAIVWVKLPSFNVGINSICMYYGNSSVPNGATNTSVWNSNYGIVYHMKAGGQDSTSNNRDYYGVVNAPTQTTSFLGYGISLDGDDAWSMQDVSYWEEEWHSRVHEIVFETGSDITSRQTLFAEGGSINGILMYIVNNQLYVRWWSESSPAWSGDYLNVSVNTNTKYYAVMALTDTGNYSLYLNGKLISTKSSVDYINAHSGNGGIGYTGTTGKDYHDLNNSAGNYFVGTIYELRTMDSEKSNAWYNEVYQNIFNHSSKTNYGTPEKYYPNLEIKITSPSTSAIKSLLQNESFELNATLNCIGKSSSSCGNVSIFTRYNNSLSSFLNISTTSGTTPTWTSSLNPQNCVLNGGNSCDVSWEINMTGEAVSEYLINVLVKSNYSEIVENLSDNLQVKVVKGEVVSFNQTSYTFPILDKNSGDGIATLKIGADIGNNTNIVVECESGDCSTITENWVDGTNLNFGESKEFNFTCSDDNAGSYSAIFNVTSDEFKGKNIINISCNVKMVYGPIYIKLLEPEPLKTKVVGQNLTFKLRANVTCNGECGNLTAYAEYLDPKGFNLSNTYYKARKEISINNVGSSDLVNFPAFLNISKEGFMQNDYDDLRFVNGSCSENNIEFLDYDVENYSSTNAYVWIRIPTLKSGTNKICMYYGNDSVTSGENETGVWIDNYYGVWHFNEGGITTRYDATSNNYNAVPSNYDSDEKVVGSVGNADNLDGTDDYLAIQTLNFATSGAINNMTACAWFKTSFIGASYSDNWAFIDFDRSEYFNFYIRGDNGALEYSTTASSIDDQPGTTTGLNDGKWHYGCAVYDGTDKIIYIDGVQDNKKLNPHSGSALGTGTTRYGFIGDGSEASAYDGTRNEIYYDGAVDEIRFSSDVKSSDWIKESYLLVAENPQYISFSKELRKIKIPDSDSLPLWTTNSQPLSCIPGIDGSCIFEWYVNATGPINSTYNVSVFVESNYSEIVSKETNDTTINITDNIIPEITLYSPTNNSKLLGNGSVEFIWLVEDDDTAVNCSIYLNGILNKSMVCYTGVNSSLNLSLDSGKYEWLIYVNDSYENEVNSSTVTFWNILKYSAEISKKIYNINDDIYKIEINISNNENYSRIYSPIDFVESKFNSGSFSPLYDWFNFSVGVFNGEFFGWNLTINKFENVQINYSITKNNIDYRLLDEYIIALD